MLLSVVIITKNAANFLAKSLESVNWADEIILLDSGSTDNTLKIAEAAGAKVFTNSNWLGYGIQRQRAQSFANGHYILMIDADELVTQKLRYSIQSVLNAPIPGIVYSIKRRNYFLGRFMRYSGWRQDRVVRLYERTRYQYNSNQIHESLFYDNAKIVALKGDLLHFACYDFANFQSRQLNYAFTWAREHHQRGKKVSLLVVFIRAFSVFLKKLILQFGILDGRRGWLLALINTQYTFNKYTELWVLNQGFSSLKGGENINYDYKSCLSRNL